MNGGPPDVLLGLSSGSLVVAGGGGAGAGNGTFTLTELNGAAAEAGGGVMAITPDPFADLNGDSLRDLVCATASTTKQSTVNTLFGIGNGAVPVQPDGTFVVQPVGGLAADGAAGATRPLLADMNGDEAMDLVLVHGAGNAVSILLNELADFTTIPGGKAGTSGIKPVLAGKGYAVIGGHIKLVVSDGLGGAPALLRVGAGPTSPGQFFTFPYDFFSLILPLGGTLGTAGAGTLSLPYVLPDDSRIAGIPFHLQVIIKDVNAGPPVPLTYSATNGLTIVIAGPIQTP